MPSVASHSNANTMSADSKSKKVSTAKKVEVAAPVVVATPAVAPVAEDKKPRGRKPAAKTELTVPVVASAAAPVVAAVAVPAAGAAPATATEAAAVVPPTISAVADRLRELQVRVTAELKELVKEALWSAKAAAREVKDARKKRKVKKDVADMTPEEIAAREARRANNAFLKPRLISPELCAFMGIEAGSSRSQTDVTKHVAAYVKGNSCFDPANKRRIIPDSNLSKLLKVTDKDTVTYLNLQSYLKAHFVKTA